MSRIVLSSYLLITAQSNQSNEILWAFYLSCAFELVKVSSLTLSLQKLLAASESK